MRRTLTLPAVAAMALTLAVAFPRIADCQTTDEFIAAQQADARAREANDIAERARRDSLLRDAQDSLDRSRDRQDALRRGAQVDTDVLRPIPHTSAGGPCVVRPDYSKVEELQALIDEKVAEKNKNSLRRFFFTREWAEQLNQEIQTLQQKREWTIEVANRDCQFPPVASTPASSSVAPAPPAPAPAPTPAQTEVLPTPIVTMTYYEYKTTFKDGTSTTDWAPSDLVIRNHFGTPNFPAIVSIIATGKVRGVSERDLQNAKRAVGQTPKSPRSPIARFADGRGPIGPVTLKIVSPTPDEVIPVPEAVAGQPPAKGAPVTLKVELANFETFEDDATKSGQHLEILVDNIAALFPWRDATKPYTFKSLPKGTHMVRIFPVRPWGEAIKEPSALASVSFHVGEKDGKNTREAGSPMLTVVAPRGKVKGDAGKVLLDVLVSGCPVAEQTVADSCRLRYKLDTQPEVTLAKVEPVWLEGLTPGRHAYVVGLTRDQKVVPGAFALYQGSFEVEASVAPQARLTSTPTAASEPQGTPGEEDSGESPAGTYFAQKRESCRSTAAELALGGGSSKEHERLPRQPWSP